MPDIQSNKQLWGKDFPVGSEPCKVRGALGRRLSPLHKPLDQSGRWTVKREETRFIVVFFRFQDGQEVLLAEYPPDEAGEIEAKTCVLHARETI